MGSRDLLSEVWDPSISQERLKLETSNLAHKLATEGPKRNNAKLGQKGGVKGSRDPLYEILRPSRYLGKHAKLGQKGSCRCHVTYF